MVRWIVGLFLVGCSSSEGPTRNFVGELERGFACASNGLLSGVGMTGLLNREDTMRLQLTVDPDQAEDRSFGVLFVGEFLDLWSDDDACDDVATFNGPEQRIEMAYSITQGSLTYTEADGFRSVNMVDVVFTPDPVFAQYSDFFTEEDTRLIEEIEVGDVFVGRIPIGGVALPVER